jgi:hypothetical protein
LLNIKIWELSARVFPKENSELLIDSTGATVRALKEIDRSPLPSGSSLVISKEVPTVAVSDLEKDTSSPMDSPGSTSVEIFSTLFRVT